MSARIARLLGRAIARSSLSEPVTLQLAGGTSISTRGHVVRQEFDKERDDGAWIIDATHFIVIETASAPTLAARDKVIDSDGVTWDILAALKDAGGCTKCQLRKVQIPKPFNPNGPTSEIDSIELDDSSGNKITTVYGDF